MQTLERIGKMEAALNACHRATEALGARLVGRRPERADCEAALEGMEIARFFLGLDKAGLLALLCDD